MGKLQRLTLVGAVTLAMVTACHGTDRLESIEEEPPLAGPTTSVTVLPDGTVPELPDREVPDDEAPLDYTPTETDKGIPGPQKTLDGGWVYRDLGEADEDDGLRGLISFPIRDRQALDDRIREIYDPSSPSFRQYYSVEQWMLQHAPLEQHLDIVSDWLVSQGMQVPRRATNHLFIQFTGTVKQFNDAFGVKVHLLERKAPQAGNPPHPVYGVLEPLKAPAFVKERIHAVVALDLPADTRALPPEGGQPDPFPEAEVAGALTPEQVAHAYGFMPMYGQGHRGGGSRIGVAVGASFRYRDLRAFWAQFGVERDDPLVFETMEPPATRYKETQLDIEWSTVMAPDAEVRVYMGPDARNTSMIYTFNEAIARNEIDVLTDSFAHREDSEPVPVREAYDMSAAMAAALGITVVAASGDSHGVDTPSNSQYVTAVGGTELLMNGNSIHLERAWTDSGSGISLSFPTPWWQVGLHPELQGMRGVSDVALNAKNGYWFLYLNRWTSLTGTSFSSPVFAGMIAVINGARAKEGKPRIGFLNQTLYTTPAVQATFRDITDWATPKYSAGPGWDFPTGWGAPDAEGLHQTLP